ncbi:MAG TPA: PLP-dependent transferase [Planctomycetota bacterium]|nr:PLP-dependent transferase [Planctomycetota bacterium]
MRIEDYQNPSGCPEARPSMEAMSLATRSIHEAIDAGIRRRGIPYLHPEDPTLMLDLFGSARMTAWQEAKASCLFEGNACWSELPQVYARYGVESTRKLLGVVRKLESAGGVILTDCGMQACALLFDTLFRPGSHAVLMRQVYNKTRKHLEWLASRLGGSLSIVDDGDHEAIERAIRKDTVLIFAETYTNPLLRAVDPVRLGDIVSRARKGLAPGLSLIVDDTIASPWGLRKPLLEHDGIDFVVSSGTKCLGGQDRDLWGYVASRRTDTLNEVMDLQAMRGGVLGWRAAGAILEGLSAARENFERRSRSAERVAAFLAAHPRVSEVHHPSLRNHPDRETIDAHYCLPGSLLSFRIRDADENAARHFSDVLATCIVPRYALSFDGLTTKVNHHRTVSEYFTPEEELERAGIDRIVRIGVGLEEPGDIVACLNWALWWHSKISPAHVAAWQSDRARDLGVHDDGSTA